MQACIGAYGMNPNSSQRIPRSVHMEPQAVICPTRALAKLRVLLVHQWVQEVST